MDIISLLYATVPAVIFFGYIPQIAQLIRAKTDCRDISLLAWMMWDYVLIVSILYGVYILHDLKFIIASVLNCACVNALIAITLYKRRKYGKKSAL
jgi:uncharacterized protein with PQ loop repeat